MVQGPDEMFGNGSINEVSRGLGRTCAYDCLSSADFGFQPVVCEWLLRTCCRECQMADSTLRRHSARAMSCPSPDSSFLFQP